MAIFTILTLSTMPFKLKILLALKKFVYIKDTILTILYDLERFLEIQNQCVSKYCWHSDNVDNVDLVDTANTDNFC